MSQGRMDEDLQFDQSHIWHPYTSMHDPLPVVEVTSATGVELHLADGRRLIDGMSSWWCAIHGYNHPELNRAAREQLDRNAHVMFGGITHPAAIRLVRKLLELTPKTLNQVFLCDSGSVAVEVAIKMALQYQFARGEAGRRRLLTIRGGYHGDTFAAMSVCDPVTGMHGLFRAVLAEQLFAPRPSVRFHDPWDPRDLDAFESMIRENAQSLAAVILEPIVQGAGGIWFYHPEYLRGVRRLCDRYGILLIADEIATGFGRSGKMFACEHAAIEADILCLGKALTGGYLSLAATLASQQVASVISSDPTTGGIFMHGPTFMANPLACAIAASSLDLLVSSHWQERVTAIETQLQQQLLPLRELDAVADTRVLGAIGAVELTREVDMRAAQKFFTDQGVWLRPFGKLIYTMPPFIIGTQALSRLTGAIRAYAELLSAGSK